MRIAQIAPLYERVPPTLYGGTERVVHNLSEELTRRGHHVTLFATGDSQTSARLVPMAPSGIRLSGCQNPLALHIAMLEEVYSQADQFDLIHSHVDVLAFPFARAATTPTISTIHGRLDFPEHHRVLERYRDLPLVSISNSQRHPVSDLGLNWIATAYNGIDVSRFQFEQTPATPPYLVFLGRISPEKGPHIAVEIARSVGIHLKVAAKIDPADEAWAKQHFLPLLDTPGVEFIGEVDEHAKADLLAGATAMLFPIDWPEPFGIVMVEALASGTPVIAFPGGSVEELVQHGITGFVCNGVDDAVQALGRIDEIDRHVCRQRVEAHFSRQALTNAYESAYDSLLGLPDLVENPSLVGPNGHTTSSISGMVSMPQHAA
jgi:glycosyltransferase involved in cell wall biosynthesis